MPAYPFFAWIDQVKHPVKLTPGNSDLYGGATPPTDSIVLKRLGELYPGLSGAALAERHVLHKYDLVFYYKYESHDKNVAPYLTGTNIASIDGNGIGDFGAWQSQGENRTFRYQELNTDGSAITRYGGKIEPHHSDNADDYFTYNAGGEGSITRFVETYRIVYTVTDGEQTYVTSRDVKLRYRVGDVNLDGFTDSTDATFTNAYSQTKAAAFINSDGTINTELCSSVYDFNYDGFSDSTDATFINAFSQSKMDLPKTRF